MFGAELKAEAKCVLIVPRRQVSGDTGRGVNKMNSMHEVVSIEEDGVAIIEVEDGAVLGTFFRVVVLEATGGSKVNVEDPVALVPLARANIVGMEAKLVVTTLEDVRVHL